MTDLTIHRTRELTPLAPPADGRPLGGRLGLDVPQETWPTAPELKRLEACGYGWIQMHAPPVAMLADPRERAAARGLPAGGARADELARRDPRARRICASASRRTTPRSPACSTTRSP